MAPWNICDYRPDVLEERVQLIYKKEKCDLIFYHFQSLIVMSDKVFIGVYNELGIKSRKLIDFLYTKYIMDIIAARELLRKVEVEIPAQVLRTGEKSSISKMRFMDFLIFCYQCIPCVLDGKKNYINIRDLVGNHEK